MAHMTANGNELHMRFFIGMRSAALIPPDNRKLALEYVVLTCVATALFITLNGCECDTILVKLFIKVNI